MVLGVINWNWGDIILNVHCFQFLKVWAALIGSIKVNKWLTASKNSNLSDIKFLIPEWVFSLQSKKHRAGFLWNSNPTNWSTVEKVLLDELVLSGKTDDSFYLKSRSWCIPRKYIQACVFVSCDIHPWEQYNERKVNNQPFQDYLGVFANHLKFRSGSV